MRRKNRVFKLGALHHIYQRTTGGYLIFYSGRVFLVFFTLFCTLARKYQITVYGLCLMYDHIHVLLKARNREDMSAFVQEYTCRFSRMRNQRYKRKGDFFRHRYGSAPKADDKKARTAIAYLLNNPVEKRLCGRAEEFQWNFLNYAHNDHPFSEPLKLSAASRALRRALEEVKQMRASDSPLRYEFIDRVTEGLIQKEIRQLSDFIVTQYNCIQYNDLTAYFEDFEALLIAIHSNTGSEYQIKEVISPGSDKIFKQLQSQLFKMKEFGDMTAVLSLPEGEKRRLAWSLAAETGATPWELSKFLHIPL